MAQEAMVKNESKVDRYIIQDNWIRSGRGKKSEQHYVYVNNDSLMTT